jgi:methionyl-tRNA synthetase
MKNFDKVITTALLYANGPLHIGHILENIQADVFVRFLRMRQQKCLFISGSDAHGTPIMLKSEMQQTSPESLVADIHQQHKKTLQQFNVFFDSFCTTHDFENKELTTEIFNDLQQANLIEIKEIDQPYDEEKQMFLPDRYIKGTCPKCSATSQYGDNCEQCGATYSASELIDPLSVISNTKPCLRKSKHYFFKLSKCDKILEKWLSELDCNKSTINKLQEWFDSGLMDWDISRDKPYFGFNIPNEPNKFFYVWLDAPIGYLAACQQYCNNKNITLVDLLGTNSKTELIHFIGKDITYFHALFWPAILHHSKYKKPTAIYPHGFLTVNHQKMSKSRNTFITAESYLENYDPDFLRYYFCSKLSAKI